jgi:hypothetical protein
MPGENTTHSSVYLRERDKIPEEKHRKEIEVIGQKIERLKWSNNDTEAAIRSPEPLPASCALSWVQGHI